MKYLPLPLLLFMAFASCHKNKDPLSGLADGTMQYKVNGTTVTVQNLGDSQGQYVSCGKSVDSTGEYPTRYNFVAQKDYNYILFFLVPTDSLHTGDYIIDTGTIKKYGVVANMAFINTASSVYLADDNIMVHISSYANGLVSGTFSGKMSPNGALSNYNSHGTTKITDGEFKNIRCTY